MNSEQASPGQDPAGVHRASPQRKDAPPSSSAETTAFAAGGLTSRILPASSAADLTAHAAGAKTPDKISAEPRTIAGRFRIQKLLGRGGMGSVYLAHDDQLDRLVALKIPRTPDDAESADKLISRFLREARAAATLSHPNICPIYDVGQDGDTHFIAMGFVSGRPLTTYTTSDKPQSGRQVALVVRKIALALEDAHQKGILHRDLKPANIMIDQRGEPIVMDFGLACRFDDWETRLTQDGKVVGTPMYMSPEQIDGRSEIGPASDVYSLGVVMYELLAGKSPFSGSLVSVVGQVLHVEPKPIAELRPDVPPALAEICQRAIAKKCADRFASMKEFAAALTDFLKGTTVVDRPAAKVELAPLPDLNQIDALMSGPMLGSINLPNSALRKKGFRAWPQPALWAVGAGAVVILIAAIAMIVAGNGKSSATDESRTITTVAARSRDEAQPGSPAQQVVKAAPPHEEPAVPVAEQQRTTLPEATAESPTVSPVLPAPSALPPGGVSPTGVAQAPVQLPADSPATAIAAGTADAKPDVKIESKPAGQDSSGANPPGPPKGPGGQEGPPTSSPNFPGAPPGPPPSGPQHGGPGFGPSAQIDSVDALVKFFKQADHNGDGRLDPTELPMHIIRRAAKNGERSVSLDEMKRAFQRMGPALFAPPTADEQRRLPNPPGGPRRVQ